ncbi:MAG: tetratricopeptide repeat protein [Paludibacter sp.]
MKLKLIFLSFLILIIPLTAFGQSIKDGETYFNNKQYSKARSVYESLLNKRPNDALYNYRYARCCYELKDVQPAIEHFEKAGTKYPLRDLYLGELYFNSYHFDKSVMAYETYIATLKPDDKSLPDLKQKVNKAEIASRLLTKVEDIAIVDSAVVDKKDFLRFYKFSKELGTLSQTLLKLKAHQVVDKIVYTTQRQDRVYYSDSIQGQMDIFTSFKLLDSFSLPVSVSREINTPANENYPFLLLDGITLYFASDGENSIGGYDLFITRYTPATNSFLKPENIGMPFNSPANDYMMVVDEQRKLGWFATDRNQPAGKVMIYIFVPNKYKIIIRSEDKDSIRAAAQLKTYRRISKSLTDSTSGGNVQLQESDNQIEFVINDSVVYTNVKQFRSEEAIKLWNQLHAMTVSLKNKQPELEKLRQQYNNTEKQEDRDALSGNIIELEKICIKLKNQITSIKTEVRNTENNFLQKKL